MVELPVVSALESAERIGFIGDVHGDLGRLVGIARTMSDAGVVVLVACGDLGLLWPGENWAASIAKLSKRLAARGQTLYWVDGNHEDFTRLQTFPVSPGGMRSISPNLLHLPRGFRTTLTSGKTLAVLGGANSVDVEQRQPGTSWWPEESITDTDLAALGHEPVDILIGHDAPLDLPALDGELDGTEHLWPAEGLAYARAGRRTFHTGFLHVRPSLYVGGHYHYPIDEIVGYFNGSTGFRSRIVLLDSVQGSGASCAVLDVKSLELTFLTSGGKQLPLGPAPVTTLTMEDEGRWLLHTLGSLHVLDLDRRTIQRIPGIDSAPTTSDGLHDLRTLDVCEIGKSGHWTMRGDYTIDYFWHVSSVIRHIERLPDLDAPPAQRQ